MRDRFDDIISIVIVITVSRYTNIIYLSYAVGGVYMCVLCGYKILTHFFVTNRYQFCNLMAEKVVFKYKIFKLNTTYVQIICVLYNFETRGKKVSGSVNLLKRKAYLSVTRYLF